MSEKPTLKDVRSHLMDHVQALTQLEHQLLGIKRQVLASYHALDELIPPMKLHVSRERLRELIADEEDLPVEVGTPFSPHMGPGRTVAPFSPPDDE